MLPLICLGRAKSVRVETENTIITEGAGSKEAIDGRISLIRKELETTESDFDREKLAGKTGKTVWRRSSNQSGAATETEMKEKKLRMEDALAATRAAVEEGIVAGGGTALIQTIESVKAACESLTGDEKTVQKLLLRHWKLLLVRLQSMLVWKAL